MGQFWVLLEWSLVGAILVLIIVNGDKTSGIITSFGAFWTKVLTTITGTGYIKAK